MFSQNLKIAREHKGLTRKAVAAHLKIHESTYGKYELGQREPALETIEQLAKLFGVTTAYLLNHEEIKNPPVVETQEDEIDIKDIRFALYGEVRELTEEDQADVLSFAKYLRQRRKEKEKENAEKHTK